MRKESEEAFVEEKGEMGENSLYSLEKDKKILWWKS